MKVRERKCSDYGFTHSEMSALRSYIKSEDFAEHDALFEAALKSNASISNEIYESLTKGISYEKLYAKKFIPISLPDFYGYQKKCLSIFRDYMIANNKIMKIYKERLNMTQMTLFKEEKVKPMRILVACEESQAVTKELRKLGHEAYSCDIQEQSGGHPEWHIKGDVLPILNGYTSPTQIFRTQNGAVHCVPKKWDMIIAFPPCTYLTVTGNRWFNRERYGKDAIDRECKREDAKEFFMKFANADCEKIAIENPVGVMSSFWRKPNQIIQPYMFGDAFEKKTCLWLKNIPILSPTNIVDPPERKKFKSGNTMPAWYADAFRLPKEERSKLRSKTFPGIARAMAEQWAGKVNI